MTIINNPSIPATWQNIRSNIVSTDRMNSVDDKKHTILAVLQQLDALLEETGIQMDTLWFARDADNCTTSLLIEVIPYVKIIQEILADEQIFARWLAPCSNLTTHNTQCQSILEMGISILDTSNFQHLITKIQSEYQQTQYTYVKEHPEIYFKRIVTSLRDKAEKTTLLLNAGIKPNAKTVHDLFTMRCWDCDDISPASTIAAIIDHLPREQIPDAIRLAEPARACLAPDRNFGIDFQPFFDNIMARLALRWAHGSLSRLTTMALLQDYQQRGREAIFASCQSDFAHAVALEVALTEVKQYPQLWARIPDAITPETLTDWAANKPINHTLKH